MPVRSRLTPVPLSAPSIQGNAWKYVKDCLDTGWVSSVGNFVTRFERATASYTGSPSAVAGVNGTSCLHLALKLLGVGPGDGVIVPALTFIATANAVIYCGAKPFFVDCEPTRLNLDLDRLEALLERGGFSRRRNGPTIGATPIRAILPAHILGFPNDMTRLMALARRHGIPVMEDAAESLGSFWNGRHTGTFGALGALSFNGNKIVTSGGGGMLLTPSKKLQRRAEHLTQQAKSAETEYIHDQIGFNYRLTNLNAALGLSQLELLPRFLACREKIAGWYRDSLPGVPVEPIPEAVRWNRWLMSAQLPDRAQKMRLLRRFEHAGIQARSLWKPIPLQRPYRGAWSTPIPRAIHAYDTIVNLPSSSNLMEEQFSRVVKVLRAAPIQRLLL